MNTRQPIIPLLFYKADLEKNENALIMVKEKEVRCYINEKDCYIDIMCKSRNYTYMHTHLKELNYESNEFYATTKMKFKRNF